MSTTPRLPAKASSVRWVSDNCFTVELIPRLKHLQDGKECMRPMVIGVELPSVTVDTLLPDVHLRIGGVISRLQQNTPLCLGTFHEETKTKEAPLIVAAEHFSRFPLSGKGDLLFPVTDANAEGGYRFVSLQSELLRSGVGKIYMARYPNRLALEDLASQTSLVPSTGTIPSTSNTVLQPILPSMIKFTGTIINVLRGDVFVVRISSPITELDAITGNEHVATGSSQWPSTSENTIAVVHLSGVRCPNVSDHATYSPADRLEGRTLSLLAADSKGSPKAPQPIATPPLHPVCLSGHPYDGLGAMRFSQRHFLFQSVECVCVSFVPSDKDLANNTQEVLHEHQEHFVGVVSLLRHIHAEGSRTTSPLIRHLLDRMMPLKVDEGKPISIGQILYKCGLAKVLAAPERIPNSPIWREFCDLVRIMDKTIDDERQLFMTLCRPNAILATYAALLPSLLQQHQRHCWAADPLQTKSLLQAALPALYPWGQHRMAIREDERIETQWVNERHKQKSDREDEMRQQAEALTSLLEKGLAHSCKRLACLSAPPSGTVLSSEGILHQVLLFEYTSSSSPSPIDKTQPFIESFVGSIIKALTSDTGCTAPATNNTTAPCLVQLQKLFAIGNESQLTTEVDAFMNSCCSEEKDWFASTLLNAVVQGLAVRHDIRFQLALARLLSNVTSLEKSSCTDIVSAALRAILEAIGVIVMRIETNDNTGGTSTPYEAYDMAAMRHIVTNDRRLLADATKDALLELRRIGVEYDSLSNDDGTAEVLSYQLHIAAARALLQATWCPVRQPSSAVNAKKTSNFDLVLKQRLPPPTFLPLKMVVSLSDLVASGTLLKGYIENANVSVRRLEERSLADGLPCNSETIKYLVRINIAFASFIGKSVLEEATQLRAREKGDILILPNTSAMNFFHSVMVRPDAYQKTGAISTVLVPKRVAIHPFPESVPGFAVGFDPGMSGIELADMVVQVSIKQCATITHQDLQAKLQDVMHRNQERDIPDDEDPIAYITGLLAYTREPHAGAGTTADISHRGIDGPLSIIAGDRFCRDYPEHFAEYKPSQGTFLKLGATKVPLDLHITEGVACTFYIVDVRASYNGKGAEVEAAEDDGETGSAIPSDDYNVNDQAGGIGKNDINGPRPFDMTKQMIFLVYDPEATAKVLTNTFSASAAGSATSTIVQDALKAKKQRDAAIVETSEAEQLTVDIAATKDSTEPGPSPAQIQTQVSQQQPAVLQLEREVRDIVKTVTQLLGVGAASVDESFLPFLGNVIANCVVSRVPPSDYVLLRRGKLDAAAAQRELGLSVQVPETGDMEATSNGTRPSAQLLASQSLKAQMDNFGEYQERTTFPSQTVILSTVNVSVPFLLEFTSADRASSIAEHAAAQLEVLLRSAIGNDAIFTPVSVVDEDLSVSRFERQCLLGDIFLLGGADGRLESLISNVTNALNMVIVSEEKDHSVSAIALTPLDIPKEILEDAGDKASILASALATQMATALIVVDKMNRTNIAATSATSMMDGSAVYKDKSGGHNAYAPLEHLHAMIAMRSQEGSPPTMMRRSSSNSSVNVTSGLPQPVWTKSTKQIVLDWRRDTLSRVEEISHQRKQLKYTVEADNEDVQSDYYYESVYDLVDQLLMKTSDTEVSSYTPTTVAPQKWSGDSVMVSADTNCNFPILYEQTFQQIADSMYRRVRETANLRGSDNAIHINQDVIDRTSLSLFSLSAKKLAELKDPAPSPAASVTVPTSINIPNGILSSFAAFPRMLFASHYDHHRGLVPKATREVARGFAHMDAAFQRLRFPRLPNIYKSCSWDDMNTVARIDACALAREHLIGSGPTSSTAQQISSAAAPPTSPFKPTDRIVATSHQIASLLATMFFALPNAGIGSSLGEEGPDNSQQTQSEPTPPASSGMDYAASLGITGPELQVVAGAIQRTINQMHYHGTLDLIMKPIRSDEDAQAAVSAHLLIGNRPSRLFTRLQSPSEVVPRKLPVGVLTRLVAQAGYISSVTNGLMEAARKEVVEGEQLVDTYNFQCMSQHGPLPTNSSNPPAILLQPQSKETSSIIFENFSKDLPYVQYRPHNGWCVLGEPLAKVPVAGQDSTSPSLVVHQYIPVRLPKGSDLYKQSSYGQIRRDDVFEVFMGKQSRSLDLIEYWKLVVQSVNKDGRGPIPADGTFKVIGNAHEPLYMMFTARRTVRTGMGVWWNVAFPLDCVSPAALASEPFIVGLLQKYSAVPRTLVGTEAHRKVLATPFDNIATFADAEETSLKSMLLNSIEWLLWLITLRLRFMRGDGTFTEDSFRNNKLAKTEQIKTFLEATASAGTRSIVMDVWEFTEGFDDEQATDTEGPSNDQDDTMAGSDQPTSPVYNNNRSPASNDPSDQHAYYSLDNNVSNRMAALKITLSAKSFSSVRNGIENGAVAVLGDLRGTATMGSHADGEKKELSKFLGADERIWRIDEIPKNISNLTAYFGLHVEPNTIDSENNFLPFIIEVSDSREVF